MDIRELIALLENAEQQCLAEYTRRLDSFVDASSAPHWQDKAAGIRFSIDTILAMMQQAQQAESPLPPWCQQCGHFSHWHGQRANGACNGGYPAGMPGRECTCREEQPAWSN